jgi:tetratricopeptide (TPR) repeat protein
VKDVEPVVERADLFGVQPALVFESPLKKQQGLLRVSIEDTPLGAELKAQVELAAHVGIAFAHCVAQGKLDRDLADSGTLESLNVKLAGMLQAVEGLVIEVQSIEDLAFRPQDAHLVGLRESTQPGLAHAVLDPEEHLVSPVRLAGEVMNQYLVDGGIAHEQAVGLGDSQGFIEEGVSLFKRVAVEVVESRRDQDALQRVGVETALDCVLTVQALGREGPPPPTESGAAGFEKAAAGLARGALALVQPTPRPGPNPAPSEAEAREQAPRLWERLSRYKTGERRAIVQENSEFRSGALCKLICERSIQAAADDAAVALGLAALALLIAELIPGEESRRSRLQAWAWAFVGNARRVGGDLPGADEAFVHSRERWTAGAAREPASLDESRLLDLEASLRREQRRLPEALELLNRALAIAPREGVGRILVKKAKTLEELADYEKAVEALWQAAPLVNPGKDPRLLLCLRFDLLVNLCHLDRHAEAAPLLPEVRELATGLGNGLDLVRLRWLEGKIAAGQGHVDQALAAFHEVREEFADRSIAYDTALVSLELAVLYLEQRRTGEVKALARQMAPIFKTQGIHREALSALRLFCEAAEKEAVTIEMVRRLVEYLDRARHEPELHFEM